MKPYLDLLHEIRTTGMRKDDRTGTGTRALFGRMFQHDLQKGFPLLTTKKVHWDSIVHELLWFISGSTNIKYLTDNGVTIWNEWADKDGELGPVYGSQWREWGSKHGGFIDQLAQVIHRIKENPDSRRHIVTAWNPDDIPVMALPPCHMIYQFQVCDDKLSCAMFQRSCDYFLGVPFNIASYALLTHMVAQVTGYKPGTITLFFGDCHLYNNHIEQAKRQQQRVPRPLPHILLHENIMNIDQFMFDDIKLVGYDPYPAIKAPISV